MNPHEIFDLTQRLGITELPESEQFATLQGVTHRNIPTAAVRTYLRESGLWLISGPTSMAGAFQVALDSDQLPLQLKAALGELYSSVFGGSAESISSGSSLVIAAKLYAGWTALVQLGVATKEQCEGFYALGGGRILKDVQELEFSGLLTQGRVIQQDGNRQALYDELYNELIAPNLPPRDTDKLVDVLRTLALELERQLS